MRRAALAAITFVVASVAPGLPGGILDAPCAAAAGSISVAVVVDAGALTGAAPTVTCVTVADGASGTDALVARARQLGAAAPRLSAAGFLCGLDGAPATGCGDDASSQVAYWSYWWASTSTPTWRYATRGSDLRQLRSGMIEGWRYVVGSASQDAGLAPRVDPASIRCAVPTPTSAAGPGPTPAPVVPVVLPATASAPPATTPGPVDSGGAPPTSPTDGSATTAPAADTTSPDATTAPSVTAPAPDDPEDRAAPAVAASADAPDEEGGAAAGPLAAAVVVASSVALAAVQARRRRSGA